ncbi:MAG: HD domain-containing protein [Anaerolineae bacterium]|nr:HD domain-containing protein [Anaerolineae bacterium]
MSDRQNLDRIAQIETFARQHMEGGEVGHDFKHVDRVRHHALYIAQHTSYDDLDRVQAAALLHDVALKYVKKRSDHGEVGSQMTEKFLTENQLFTSEEVAEIVHAIRWHDSVKRDPGRLLAILRDADMLEIFGAVGLIRAFTSKAMLPEYDAAMLPAETWGLSAEGFTQRFASGAGIGATIMDQVSFQISCFENLNTEIARQIARPLVDYMRGFATQLVKEITQHSELYVP